jgi:hypothetical protein
VSRSAAPVLKSAVLMLRLALPSVHPAWLSAAPESLSAGLVF